MIIYNNIMPHPIVYSVVKGRDQRRDRGGREVANSGLVVLVCLLAGPLPNFNTLRDTTTTMLVVHSLLAVYKMTRKGLVGKLLCSFMPSIFNGVSQRVNVGIEEV